MIASTDLWVSGCGPSDGGEGTPYTPLVAPTVTQGRITRASDGTVSTTITVGAASGGSGSYTYSVGSLDKPGGSTALLSAGTAPTTFTLSNMDDGESYVVYGTVTDAGDVSQVVTWSHTVVVAEAGGGGGSGAAYTSVRQIDLDSAANDGPHTSGTHTATDGDGDSVSYTVLQRSGTQSGDVSVVNGTGVEVSGAGSSGVVLAAYDVGGVYDDEGVDRGGLLPRVIHLVVEGIDLASESLLIGMNTVNDTTGGAARMLRMEPSGGGYQVRTRVNTTDGAVFTTGASIPASMVFTFVLYDAHQVDALVTEGSTPPTDLETGSVSIGAQSRGQQTDGTYEAGNMRLIAACVGAAQQINPTIYVGRLA